MKFYLKLILFTFVLAGCRKDVEPVTVSAAAYVDDKPAIANFVLLDRSNGLDITDAGTMERFFLSKPERARYATTEYSINVRPGEYILIIQLTNANAGIPDKSHTYNYITTRGTSTRSKYTMQFLSGRSPLYQPWLDRK
jgi:hypothetical protein